MKLEIRKTDRFFKYRIVILALCLIPIVKASSMGLGEWSHETKNGISLHNTYGSNYIEWKGGSIQNVRRWYYFRNHIIGIVDTISGKTDSIEYFILNETTKELIKTTNPDTWKNHLKQKKLNPIILRWYQDHSPFIIVVLFLFSYHYWYISIPLALALLFLISKLVFRAFKAKFNLAEYSVQILVFLFFLSCLAVWNYTNFNSI